MIHLVILGVLLTTASAQRPSFAGSSPIGYPGLASRFKGTSDSPTSNNGIAIASTTSGNAGVAGSGSDVFNSRVGENDNGDVTGKIPVDARGDVNLVNRLNQWPRENRPFWLLNAEHIEQQRNATRNKQAAADAVLQSRNAIDTEQQLVYKPVIRRVIEEPDDSFFVRSEPVRVGVVNKVAPIRKDQRLQPRSYYGTY